jgi:hypothetical protein
MTDKDLPILTDQDVRPKATLLAPSKHKDSCFGPGRRCCCKCDCTCNGSSSCRCNGANKE